MAALKCIPRNVCQCKLWNCANEVSATGEKNIRDVLLSVVDWMHHQDPRSFEVWVCWIPLQG